jgi:hypothetical protein
MKRKLLLIVGFACILYVAWPYYAAYRLADALEAGDQIALDELVEWPTLREGLKADISAALMAKSSTELKEDARGIATAFAAAIGPMLAERLVSTYVTPQGLARLIQARKTKNGEQGESHNATLGFKDQIWAKVHYAFFVNPTAFQIRMSNPGAARSDHVVAMFRFKFFGWKLARIYLPKNFMDDSVIGLKPSNESAKPDIPDKLGAGLIIKVIEHHRSVDGDTVALIVRGEIRNTSTVNRNVPRLKAILRNSYGATLKTWTFTADQKRLEPGRAASFLTRVENPSSEATALNIDFVGEGR